MLVLLVYFEFSFFQCPVYIYLFHFVSPIFMKMKSGRAKDFLYAQYYFATKLMFDSQK